MQVRGEEKALLIVGQRGSAAMLFCSLVSAHPIPWVLFMKNESK
jgi:hypothetical protein